ncbi:MAG: TraY domain-containing protein [Kiritimatiellae bacterium]|nr:TraY domain-containing protein [Kiritimatiellia bacterium]
MNDEKMLNVPLDDETRKALDARADENGRAASREAAQIIKDTVKRPAADV